MKRRDIIVLATLTFIFCVLVLLYTGTNNIYGSMTDWVMQHTVFPDYFRTLFYSTGDLTPNLALHMGAGQNIYYFSYYGLLNPFILLSYLFPFVKMIDYLIVINIIIVITSGFLVYKWLMNNKYDYKIAFIASILFMLINAFYHAHRHIMFIDYMPFLILGLIGIDKYFKNHKSYLYILSVFLMIMSSYYFSVGGLLCLVIYGVYKYIALNDKITIKKFTIDGLKFTLPMITGILMASILLIPTVLAIASSRSQVKDAISIKSILLPHLNFDAILYSNYGMGFTAIAIISLLYLLFHSKKEQRFLSTTLFIIFIIPIFMYFLNGMLYLRGKVFIPLSPLLIIITAIFLTHLKDKKVQALNYVIAVIIAIVLALIFKYFELAFYIDLLLTTLLVIIYLWKRKSMILYIGLAVIAIISNIAVNKNDSTYVPNNIYQDIKSNNIKDLTDVVKSSDNSFYRMTNLLSDSSLNVNRVYDDNYYQTSIYSSTYNPYYKNLYDNVMNNAIPYRNKLMMAMTSDIVFQTLMGVKYVVTTPTNVPIGYTPVSINSKAGIYQNNNVMPLGYSTSSLMSTSDFDKLNYPYRNEALLNVIVVDKKVSSSYQTHLTKLEVPYEYVGLIKMREQNGKMIIDSDNDTTIRLQFNTALQNQVLFVKFKVNTAPNCSNGDIGITINGVTNKLTCKQWLYFNDNYSFEYVISNVNDIDALNITFSKGHFEISDMQAYSLDYNYVVNSVNNVSKFIVDKTKTKGNIIEGSINNISDGYFATTLPFDKGYTVYVDGKKTSYELVNEAFIGFPLSKGNHDIKFIYQSPGYNTGLLLTVIGFISFGSISLYERKKTK